ncbi:GMC family oxidoreductase N-terminal domain-containing protein (plasmid) [Leisingera caerulea]|uniref:GMC family oxidoreductase N-terminal domain-containing protein n=1 Tax=Leisingera caerulea TaxID=506591 RepID=A0ABY5X2X0_LEICA|nr:GMC family oxidoreductase N-terminal domain-containing protein [Leisingera caerulea]UWQ60946.1 GMC family oxidoreductase N-terminal domain-containing protein [Leisingera caerulea]
MAQTFDFIIVGAGSAGCVLADKLTASGRYNVLLIEAGGTDRRFWIKVPVGYGFTFSNPAVNWRYSAAADPGLNGREAYWPRGKVLGGSSSINAMAYVRGLPHDFDDWEAAGATGWGWETVRRGYEALESNDEWHQGRRRLRGTGPVRVTDLSERMHPFTRNFLAAGQEMGWPVLPDMNGPADTGANTLPSEGMGYVRSTVKGGRRWSSADAFLRPAMRRGNLTVVSGALVEKVLTAGGRATGVAYRVKGQTQLATAAREVILSAGAVNSPQLLQLSGIGPAALLQRHGIAVKHDLPQVGRGLQDHLAVSHFFWANTATLNDRLGSFAGQMKAGLQYVLSRKGPLSVPVNQCSGFVRSQGAALPDVQVYCNPASYSTRPSGKPQIDRDNGFLLCVQPGRPTSRGQIAIQSADPAQPPRIEPNSLATDEDKATAVRASRLLQALAAVPAINRVTRERRAPDILEMDDAALLENFRNRAGSVFHASCTCRMGREASDSVLDARLRVHGMAGLRVIDASAFPNITSGNTNAPTMMLAARAADLVLEDNKNRPLAAE